LGVLIVDKENINYKSFWANNSADEATIWQKFTAFLDQFPGCPIYHYGSYEVKAINPKSRSLIS